MSSPAGWYPQPDGQQRYWDGELWTEHFAPGVQAETSALPLLKTKQGFVFRGRSFSKAAAFGWGGLALAALIGAMSSGFSGAAIMLGLFAFVVGVIALARGKVGWAQLRNRAAGGVAIGAAMVFLTVGALAAPADTSPTTESAMTSSDSPTTIDAAAEAAAQAAATERAAADAAAAEATAAADKAAAEASAKATADAAAAKATADAVAAKNAQTAATKEAEAVAAASAKAKAAAQAKAAAAAAAAAAAVPPPPSAKTYDNCTDMHVDYKGGVALPGAVDHRSNGGHAQYAPVYSTSLYNANSGSDRDGDGIACEA
ncbi:MAG TPA: DUF2510 domain-containing protein [Tepidiformaceae bacterium]